jgi:hypothetical protein
MREMSEISISFFQVLFLFGTQDLSDGEKLLSLKSEHKKYCDLLQESG